VAGRAALVERGFQVVRMDNRDSGLSTWLRQYDGRRGLAYTLADMAGDVVASSTRSVPAAPTYWAARWVR
jgi:hypothetical protein